MSREARAVSKTGIYHIMLRGINQQQIFQDEEDCNKFLQTLKESKEKLSYEIYAYCLMGNHVHLLIKEIEEQIGQVTPVFFGEIPTEIYPLISKICAEQKAVFDAISRRDIEAIFNAFASDPFVTCSIGDARKMFDEMVENTKAYLTDYNL